MYKIYGRDGCTSCESAKSLLEQKSLPYQYLKLGKDYELSVFSSIKQGHRSFPLITLNEEYIGTFEDLKEVV